MLDGGLLTIYQNCLNQLSQYILDKDIEVIALVGKKPLFEYQNIKIIEFPKSKKSWIFRIYYEYCYFKKLSKQLKPDIWLSMHDVSPFVICEKQFVYCHNPNIFYKPKLKDWLLEYKVGIFYYVYKFIYLLNIKSNKAVFVQQHWIKKEFESIFKIKNIVVAPPSFITDKNIPKINLDDNKINFFYPTFPRVFKNIELIADAVKLLPIAIRNQILVHVTIANSDNKYASYIVNKFSLPEINYIGKIDRETVFGYYQTTDCLLFTSKLETWGLPISEAKAFQLPMLLANLPYAKESVGNYEKVSFFNVDNAAELSNLIQNFVSKTIEYDGNKKINQNEFEVNNWFALFDFIIKQ